MRLWSVLGKLFKYVICTVKLLTLSKTALKPVIYQLFLHVIGGGNMGFIFTKNIPTKIKTLYTLSLIIVHNT
jgi:hypothetical protein